jgi:hypothetical protein
MMHQKRILFLYFNLRELTVDGVEVTWGNCYIKEWVGKMKTYKETTITITPIYDNLEGSRNFKQSKNTSPVALPTGTFTLSYPSEDPSVPYVSRDINI